MNTRINNPATHQVQSVIWFSMVKNNATAEIHDQICNIYRPNVMNDSEVR